MGTEELSLHQNPPFFLWSQKEEFQGAIIGVSGLGAHHLCIYWVGAQSGDVKSSEDE